MTAITPHITETYFLSLLRGATRFQPKRAQVLRVLEANPETCVPWTVSAIQHGEDLIGQTAASLLEQSLSQTNDVSLLKLVRSQLPGRSIKLARVGTLVYRKLLDAIDAGRFGDLALKAVYLNNFSEWLALASESAAAAEVAATSVALFKSLILRRAELTPNLVLAQMTLAKRLTDLEKHDEACKVTADAIKVVDSINHNPEGIQDPLLASALTCHASRCNSAKRYAEGIPAAKSACTLLEELQAHGMDVSTDLAFACHTTANALIETGQFAAAEAYARQARDLFWTLAANDRDMHLDTYAAAANSYSVVLSRQGKSKEAVRETKRSVQHLQTLIKDDRAMFAREYVAYLISSSASHGEAGYHPTALHLGREALKWAIRLRRNSRRKDLILEVQARHNLFNRKYEAAEFSAALRQARSTVQLLEKLPKHQRLNSLLIQSCRDYAEALRVTAKSKAKLKRAVTVAQRSVRLSNNIPPDKSLSHLELRTRCLTTLALCLADSGAIKAALVCERQSLEGRRALYTNSPDTYRRPLAFSLCSVAQYELESGNQRAALSFSRNATQLYRELAEISNEPIAYFQSRASLVHARILCAGHRPKAALRCLRGMLDNANQYADKLDKVSRGQIAIIQQEHDYLATQLSLPKFHSD